MSDARAGYWTSTSSRSGGGRIYHESPECPGAHGMAGWRRRSRETLRLKRSRPCMHCKPPALEAA